MSAEMLKLSGAAFKCMAFTSLWLRLIKWILNCIECLSSSSESFIFWASTLSFADYFLLGETPDDVSAYALGSVDCSCSSFVVHHKVNGSHNSRMAQFCMDIQTDLLYSPYRI